MGSQRKVSPWLVGAICLVAGLGAGGALMLALQRRGGISNEDLASLTAPVEQSDLTLKIRANGTIVPVRSVNLSPKTSGKLESVLVKQGDRVSEGDLIALMESRNIDAQTIQAKARLAQAQARLEESKAGDTEITVSQLDETVKQAQAQIETELFRVEEAEAQVAEAKAQLALAQKQYDRNRPLLEAGAITGDRLDELGLALRRAEASLQRSQAGLRRVKASESQARSRLEEAELRREDAQGSRRPEQIAQAQAQVTEALGNLQAIEVQKEDTQIKAPFSGIVTQRFADPGAFVTPTTSASSTASATSTSIVALAEGLEVLANVPEVDIGQIFEGQTVELGVDSYPDRVFSGTVRLIAPEAVKEQNVTSFQIRVALTDGESQLRSGMNADLAFLGESINAALVVPTVAIVTEEGERGLLIPDQKNKPKFRPVTTGVTLGKQTQIIEGVELGERVFIDRPPGREFSRDRE